MASFLGLLTYFSVNVANRVFYWRFRREKFNFFLNGVVPVFGIAVVCYILYESYLASLWNAGWVYGRSVQLSVVLWLIAGLAWTISLKRRKPGLFEHSSEVFEEHEEAPR